MRQIREGGYVVNAITVLGEDVMGAGAAESWAGGGLMGIHD